MTTFFRTRHNYGTVNYDPIKEDIRNETGSFRLNFVSSVHSHDEYWDKLGRTMRLGEDFSDGHGIGYGDIDEMKHYTGNPIDYPNYLGEGILTPSNKKYFIDTRKLRSNPSIIGNQLKIEWGEFYDDMSEQPRK